MSRKVLWPALLAIVLFAPGLGNGFIYDDEALLVENTRVDLASPKLAFTSDFWGTKPDKDAWRYMHYRPLGILLYSAIYRLFGLSPFALHSANMLLNAAAVVALYALTSALGYSPGVAMAAALLFAVHPLHVEAVGWMTGLTETLAAALSLVSLSLFAHGRRAAAIAFAAAAMLSKESALVLVGLVFVLAFIQCSDGRRWRTAIEAATPYATLAAAYLCVRAILFAATPPGAVRATFATRWMSIPLTIGGYVKLLFLPWPMALTYELPPPAWTVAALTLAACFVIVAINMPSLRDELIPAGALLALPLAIPVVTSPIMVRWLQVQDRYAYLATSGACLLLAVVLERISPKVLLYGCLLLVPLGALATHLQLQKWESNETLWTHTLEVTPSSRIAALNLAYAMYVEQRFAEAERVYRRALIYNPHDKDLIQSLSEMRKGHGTRPAR